MMRTRCDIEQSNEEFEAYFMTWFRNGCTANTMEQAADLFQSFLPEKQAALRNEYEANLQMIADFSRNIYSQD